MSEDYMPVIGLEVHAQLATKSKLFAPDVNRFGCPDNENISEVSLAHPGTLPVLNEAVFPLAIKLGLACKSAITEVNYFDRKNYFYPDLPKGYQITQDSTPVCVGGYVNVFLKDHSLEKVVLNRIHIEEDAGKSKHVSGDFSEINYNRAGVPLVEIVTEPCIHDAEVAGGFVTEIRKLLRWLEVGNGNMEQGSLRCDVNVSVMKKGAQKLGTKVEIKNLNSIKNVQRAIKEEVKRQISILERGGVVDGNTRDFDAVTGQSKALRSKETLNDYRYFPDPDISPYMVSETLLSSIEASMPELPEVVYKKIITDYKMSYKEADFVTTGKTETDYFKQALSLHDNPKKIVNWMMGPLKTILNEKGLTMREIGVSPKQLTDLIRCIDNGTVTHTMAVREIFPKLWGDETGAVEQIIEQLGLDIQHDSDGVDQAIKTVLEQMPDKVAAYKSGKKGLLQMFVGQCMRALKGKVNAKELKEKIEKKLS